MAETGTEKWSGIVKWYSKAKGYGFIQRQDDDQEFFVHYSGIADQESRVLWEGEKVSFEVTEGPRGPLANNVRPLE